MRVNFEALEVEKMWLTVNGNVSGYIEGDLIKIKRGSKSYKRKTGRKRGKLR